MANQLCAILPRPWLQYGQMLLLKTVSAISRLVFVVGRGILSVVCPSTADVQKSFVLIKFQFLLLEVGDFILRINERRFLLAQRVFQAEHFLLHCQELGLVGEQAVLSFEKLIVELGDCRSHLVEVANANRRLANISRSGECCGSSTDER